MANELNTLSAEIGAALVTRDWRLATAESCTGGWIAETVTATAGASAWFDRGFVTYSNEAKQEMLGVLSATLNRHGAVSAEAVREMVLGALVRSRAQVAVAVSGIAGPTGATPEKPVGTVFFAWAHAARQPVFERCQFDGERDSIRRQTVLHALRRLLLILNAPPR